MIFKNFCEQYEEGYIIDVDANNELLSHLYNNSIF